jgi:hypothetical protein
MEGQTQLLSNQVLYSTLNIYCSQQKGVGTEFWVEVGNAMAYGWHLLKGVFVFLASGWPVILLALAGGISYRVFRKRKQQRETQPTPDRQQIPKA